tara:strand:- start:1116 stop:1358 length:243 start_codon:yes stop_codon:yes gene_type:complete
MIIKIITIFHSYDEEELHNEDFGGDYGAVEVYMNDKLVKSYGDYYHDKGDIAADAFIEGYLYCSGDKNTKIIRENEARMY